jgi:hypothetical protein
MNEMTKEQIEEYRERFGDLISEGIEKWGPGQTIPLVVQVCLISFFICKAEEITYDQMKAHLQPLIYEAIEIVKAAPPLTPEAGE